MTIRVVVDTNVLVSGLGWGGPSARILDEVRSDDADNRVLEAAVASDADYVVSGDGHLLELASFEDIPILTPAVFCAQVLDDSG